MDKQKDITLTLIGCVALGVCAGILLAHLIELLFVILYHTIVAYTS